MRRVAIVLVFAWLGCSRLNPVAPPCPGCKGQPCEDAGTCNTGFCVDGVCCDGVCGAACDRCDVEGSVGTCTAAPLSHAGDPSCAPYACDGVSVTCPITCDRDETCAAGWYCDGNTCKPATCTISAECASDNYCNASGRCRPTLTNSNACTDAVQCKSGFCTDGVCCNSACTDACAACNNASALGTCSTAPARAAGRPACSPLLCNGATTACPTSCVTNLDCAVGFACSNSTSPASCLGDGDKDGVADPDDCAPTDSSKSLLKPCFLDGDGDGVFAPVSTPTCSGATCPAGTRADAGTDCDDADAGGYQLLTCSFGADLDNDGYRAGLGVPTCTATGCPAGASSLRDCDDGNANAHPGQLNYFAVARDGGSYDYDCDGLEAKDPYWDCTSAYAGTAACQSTAFTGQRGFVGGSPGCGDAGTYRTCASWENATCSSITWWFGGCGLGCVSVDGGTSFSVAETTRLMDCR